MATYEFKKFKRDVQKQNYIKNVCVCARIYYPSRKPVWDSNVSQDCKVLYVSALRAIQYGCLIQSPTDLLSMPIIMTSSS